MLKNKNIIALIPAREGSKGIPKKNILNLEGFPLVSYSIIAAKMSKNISRIIVSTDSQEIADISKKYGAEVPFLRPAEFATDTAGDIDVIKHTLQWLENNESFVPKYIVYLRPTTPLRDPDLIDKAIEFLFSRQEATCLRSGYKIRESPYKFFGKEKDFFIGLFPQELRFEYYNLPRQSFPPTYQPNGYIDIWKTETIKKTGMLHGSKILAFITPDTGEIDNFKDLDFIKFNIEKDNYKIYDYLKYNFKLIN